MNHAVGLVQVSNRDRIAIALQRGSAHRAVVVDIEHRDTRQAHGISGMLARTVVAVDIAGVDLLHFVIVEVRILPSRR